MLHEIISKKKSGGNNGSRGVMNYMLKGKDGSPRAGATVLRGDIETQAKLIDSLVGKFKQQYITGCFSFEEAPDQVSETQKNDLMDMAEETILAGLHPDRVSITWIEHTDKDRLELNYIVAQIDLEHGRSFQPYVHSHDKNRFNALCTIQNIKNGYTDPNDPAKAQHLKRPSKLPSEAKKLKEVLNSYIENLVVDGVINNRNDVIKAFEHLGFEVSRKGNTSISFKRPEGRGRNLKFLSSNEGGLYGINFDSSAEDIAKITRASADFRASAGQRLETAQRIYDRELVRKREYHQDRHSRPKSKQTRTKILKPVNPVVTRYTPFDKQYIYTIPNPFIDTLRKRIKRDRTTDANLKTRPINRTSAILSNSGLNDYEQRASTTSSESSAKSARDYKATAGCHRQSEQILSAERARYRAIDDIIRRIGIDSSQGNSIVTEAIQGVRKLNQSGSERVQKIAERTNVILNNAGCFSERVSDISGRANQFSSFNERISNRVSEA